MINIQKIMSDLEDQGIYNDVGLRIDSKDYELGDYLPPSRVWSDGEATEEMLEGVSCLKLEAADNAKYYIKNDSKMYILAGSDSYEGNDLGERVVIDAIVVMILNKR